MKHIVHEQLSKTVAVMQKVMADDALMSTVVAAAEATAQAMLAGRKLMVAGTAAALPTRSTWLRSSSAAW